MRLFKRLNTPLPRSLFGRTLLILVVPLILVQIIAAWVFYDRHWDIISKRLAHAVAGEIALLIPELEQAPASRERTVEAFATATDIKATMHDGAVLADEPLPSGRGILEKRLGEALAMRVGRPFRMDTTSFRREILIEIGLPQGVLGLVVPRSRLFSSTTYILFLWMTGSSLLLLAVAGLFLRNQVRPIRQLAAAADAFGKGRPAGSFKISGASEVRQAALAFTLMRDRIQRQIAQRTEMLAGVSHDLRTPLTRMKLALALLGDSEVSAELKQDVVEMERMLEAYLAFARGEGGETTQPTDLCALVSEVASDARRGGAEVSVECPDRLLLPVRPNAVKRGIANIVENAARHGRQVRLQVKRRRSAVQVIVDDDGPGIPEDQRENVFRPFFRLDESRNPATGGVGLGLSIARDVVRGHGGEVTLQDSPQGGLRVLVRLPL